MRRGRVDGGGTVAGSCVHVCECVSCGLPRLAVPVLCVHMCLRVCPGAALGGTVGISHGCLHCRSAATVDEAWGQRGLGWGEASGLGGAGRPHGRSHAITFDCEHAATGCQGAMCLAVAFPTGYFADLSRHSEAEVLQIRQVSSPLNTFTLCSSRVHAVQVSLQQDLGIGLWGRPGHKRRVSEHQTTQGWPCRHTGVWRAGRLPITLGQPATEGSRPYCGC